MCTDSDDNEIHLIARGCHWSTILLGTRALNRFPPTRVAKREGIFRRECLDDDGELSAAAELGVGGGDVAGEDTFEGGSVADNVLGEDGVDDSTAGICEISENFD